MSELKQLQQQFMDFVYKKDSIEPSQYIRAGKTLDSHDSLTVYRNSVFGNLTNALGDIYPALKQCLGENFFNAMAQRYIELYPSRSASLDNYGEHLADFIRIFPPLADYEYCIDLAKLEWAWHQAFHSVDEAGFDLSKLVDMAVDDNEDAINFKLFEGASLLHSKYPIFSIWQMSIDDIEGANNTSQPVDLDAGEQFILIWRAANFEMRIDLLSEIQFDVLTKIKNRESLGTILTSLQSKYPTEEINDVFTDAVQFGWLANS